MGAWYWIGVSVGIGTAIGLLQAGFWDVAKVTVPLEAAALGFAAGWGISAWQAGGWADRIGAVAGVLLGLAGAIPLVVGALRRGGTRDGLMIYLGGAAVVLAGIAFIPAAGYLEAVALPVLALRIRRTQPERYAGLRTLAKD